MASVGAAVWPEAIALLSESQWIHNNFDPRLPRKWSPDPHHLTTARQRLVASDVLVELSELISGVRISAWADNRLLIARGRRTEVTRLAATKRRLYRTFRSWAGDNRLCGDVAESLVGNTLTSLAGRYLWLPPSLRAGQVAELLGRPIEVAGPLDAAGHLAVNPERPQAGLIPFAVEIKNVRAVIYPWDHEAWDLLAKVGAFPDVLPLLVARKVHHTTFRFFKDIGALAHVLGFQCFATQVDRERFRDVTGGLSLRDARQIDPTLPDARLVKFFSETAPRLAQGQLAKWEIAAPIVDRYREMRDESVDGSDRTQMWFEFSREIVDAGLNVSDKWAPHEFELEAEEVGDEGREGG
jgi:hypothetical protein